MRNSSIYLTYIFSLDQYPKGPFNSIDIASAFEGKSYLTRSEILEILEKDTAGGFSKDNVRFYDEPSNSFQVISEAFQLEPNTHLILLLEKKIRAIDLSIFSIIQKEIGEIRAENQNIKGENQQLKILVESFLKKMPSTNQTKSESINENLPSISLIPNNGSYIASYLPENQATIAMQKLSKNSNNEMTTISSNHDLQSNEQFVTSPQKPVSLTNMHSSYTPKSHLRKLDIAVLYSAPLVKRTRAGVYPLNDPVDFNHECTDIRNMLEEQHKRIKMRVDVATIRSLTDIITKQPVILHFICHGDWDASADKQKYFLAFENEYGELEACHSDRIRKMLLSHNAQSSIQIVFVNACHSEEVGRVFLEAGVPCVIAVQSDLKIQDDVARNFAKIFYQQIFNMNTIRESFEKAMSLTQFIQDKNIYTCCCAHKHHPNCEWEVRALEEGFSRLHSQHIPKCLCKKGYMHIHKNSCPWALSFTLKFPFKEDETKEEIKDNDSLELENDEIFICCCRKYCPHNEILKFKLMFNKPEEQGDYRIFDNIEEGILEQQNPNESSISQYPEIRLVGRNYLVHRILCCINRENDIHFIQISGESGSGKTELVKQTINYGSRRGMIEKAIYQNLEGQTLQIMNFPFEEEFYCGSKNKKSIYILDNCDVLLETNGKSIITKLQRIEANARNVKFILITNSKKKLGVSETNVYNIQVGALDSYDAASLFISNCHDVLPSRYEDPEETMQLEIMKDLQWTPKKLKLLAKKFQETVHKLNFRTFCEVIMREGIEDKVPIVDLGNDLCNLKQRRKKAYELLLFLAQFHSGLLWDDLEVLALINKIPANWLELLETLTVETLNIKKKDKGKFLTKSAPLTMKKNYSDELKNSIKETKAIPPNDYFWLKIMREKTGTLILVKHHIIAYLKEKELRNYEIEYKALEYLMHLSSFLMRKIKLNKNICEKLVEHCRICSEGFWESQEFDAPILDENVMQIMEDIIDLNLLFEVHKNNFYNILYSEDIALLIQSTKIFEFPDSLRKIIYNLCVNIPSIFKILVSCDEAIELCEAALNLCQQLPIENKEIGDDLKNTIAQLNLMLIAIFFNEAFHKNQNELKYKKLEKQLHQLEGINDSWRIDLIRLEITFIRAMIFYENSLKPIKNRYLISFFIQNDQLKNKDDIAMFNEALCYITLSKKYFNHERKFKQLFPILYGKIVIMEWKITALLKEQSEIPSLKEEILQAIELMRKKNLIHLEILGLQSIIEYNLRVNKRLKDKNLLIMTKKKYAQVALEKAREIDDKTLESECELLLNKIHRKIQKFYFSVFWFMQASPHLPQDKSPDISPFKLHSTQSKNSLNKSSSDININEFNGQDSKENSLVQGSNTKSLNNKNLGLSFIISSYFRKSIIEKMSNFKVNIKISSLTRTNLFDALTKGCKILYLKFHFDDCLLLENEQGALDILTLNELKTKFSHKKKTYIDLLFLCIRDGSTLIPFFIEIGISNIIYFEFKPHNDDGLLKHLQDVCLNGFSQKFYGEFFQNNSISKSFSQAKDFIVSNIYSKYLRMFKDLKGFEETLGNGPILYPFAEKLSNKQNLENFILEEVNSFKASERKDFMESEEMQFVNIKVNKADSKEKIKIRRCYSQGPDDFISEKHSEKSFRPTKLTLKRKARRGSDL